MIFKFLLFVTLMLNFSCTTNDLRPTDPFVLLGTKNERSASVQDWIEYNHFFRSIPLKAQQNEFKQIEKQVGNRDLKDDEKHKAMFKYVIASYQVSPTLPQLIQAKAFLNDLISSSNKDLPPGERHFWELFSDNLNDSIRFYKLHALVTKKYEEERLARIELEEKIKSLTDIEQVTDERTEIKN